MNDIVMRPVGIVKNEVNNKKDISWGEDFFTITLLDDYYGGLKGLEDFSHVTNHISLR